MGTLNAVYLSNPSSVPEPPGSLTIVRTHENKGWQAWILPGNQFRIEDTVLESLSSNSGGDIILLSFQSVVDAFQFVHYRNGTLLRKLVFGCFDEERTWEHASGTRQAWEDCMFDESDLANRLSDADSEEEKEELKAIWQGKVIAAGACDPSLDARSTAWSVATHYDLPGWE